MKKKAIKIAAASVVSASAAIAPFAASAASVSVDTYVNTAVNAMKGAQGAYVDQVVNNGVAVSAATVQTAISKAQVAYKAAMAAIAKNPRYSKYYYSKLAAVMPNYNLAVKYVVGKSAAEAVNASDLQTAINNKDAAAVKDELASLNTAIQNAQATISKNVVGAATVRAVLKSLAPAQAVAAQADAFLKAQTPAVASVSAIDDITVDEGTQPTLPSKVTVTYADNTTADVAVTWDTTKLDVNTPNTYTLTGTIDGTDKTASVNVIVKAAAPQVKSVSAINGEQLLVKFNKPVNGYSTNDGSSSWLSSAANINNYTIAGGNSVSAAKVQDDGQSVVLTLSSPVVNTTSATYSLTVSGVTLADTVTTFPTFAGVVTVADTTAPTVSSVQSSTNGATASQLTVNFSEPVAQVGAIKVDGKVVTGFTINPGDASTTISGLSLDSSKVHTVEVVNLQDLSGNTNSYQSTTLNITKDAVAPVISSVTAKGDTALEVTFSKKMGTVTPGSFSLKDEAYNNIQVSDVQPDPADTTGTKYVVTFAQDNTFFANSNTRNLTLVVAGTGVSDSLGNVLSATTKTVSVTKDTTAPTVTSFTVQKDNAGNVISLTANFSKALTGTTVAASNVTLVDSNGVQLVAPLKDAVVKTGDTSAVFAVNGVTLSGKYSVALNAGVVTDTALSLNKNTAFSGVIDCGTPAAGAFTLADNSVSSSNDNTNVLTVNFGTVQVKGGVTAGSATDASNYTINGRTLPAGTVITLQPGQKVAVIKLPAGAFASTDTAAILRISGVQSLTGSTITPYTQTLTITDNVAPVLSSASVNADGTLSLGFSEALATLAANVNTADFSVKVNGTAEKLVFTDGTGADTGKYVVTVDDATTSSKIDLTKATSVVVSTVTKNGSLSEVDAYGNALTEGSVITVK